MSTNAISYLQLASSVNPSFWNKLSELKLSVYKLDEDEQHIWGYSTVISEKKCPATLLEVDSTSFNNDFDGQTTYLAFHGKLFNKNTLEQFKECDKLDLINNEGQLLLERIKDGTVLADPSFLNNFLLLSFADLKKYHYYYWFAFPVPKGLVIEKIKSCPITNEFSKENLDKLLFNYKQLETSQRGYFLLQNLNDNIKVYNLSSKLKNLNLEESEQYYFVFHNHSYDNTLVGSQLRNYVALILNYCDFLQKQVVNFIALHLCREGSFVTCKESIVYKLKLPTMAPDLYDSWVGWEKNEREKMGPRLANMKSTLDPLVIAENSVDLNLKLMKWNLLPNIDLEKIKLTKCLLLGSGTLGCSIARILLGWGVRNITFVDNSTVSFSNPVRQSLFTYQDSVEMKPKSNAAADNLRTIFPGVNSRGFQLTIPMPGHSIGDSMLESTKQSVNQLNELIKEHNVIFLLMDSRESRWLPTLLANIEQKIVITAALGFDTYLVMRHGIFEEKQSTPPLCHPEGFKTINGANLACYFCNDVTAPGNSTRGRTLDQQCTVTRPGVSQIAGALAAELAISILQHEEGILAPAFYFSSQASGNLELNPYDQSLLGLVPHSIRGFLSSYEQILPATEKYKNCVACSELVVKEYKTKGTDFLLNVFNSSKHLEDVALLTEMFKETDFGEVLEFSDEEF